MRNKILLGVVFVLIMVLSIVIYHEKKTNYYFPMPSAVKDDENIIIQTNKGEPVITNKKAPSGKAYIEISRRILGENIEVTVPGKEKGFFAKLKRLFKKDN